MKKYYHSHSYENRFVVVLQSLFNLSSCCCYCCFILILLVVTQQHPFVVVQCYTIRTTTKIKLTGTKQNSKNRFNNFPIISTTTKRTSSPFHMMNVGYSLFDDSMIPLLRIQQQQHAVWNQKQMNQYKKENNKNKSNRGCGTTTTCRFLTNQPSFVSSSSSLSLSSVSSSKCTSTATTALRAVGNIEGDEMNMKDPNNNDAQKMITNEVIIKPRSIWETMAYNILLPFQKLNNENESNNNNDQFATTTITKSILASTEYCQLVTLLRVGIPAFIFAIISKIVYPDCSMYIANNIIQNDNGVIQVVSQDLSQYIQNILTTSGLIFALLIGQTYYFMYQQQESTYLALYEEVSVAKTLLEQIAFISLGRSELYLTLLNCMKQYIETDLMYFNDIEPAYMISCRPCDDPFENILYYTSVGEPSMIYMTVKSLRLARARRLGSLQKKLPNLHMILLWVLYSIVLFTFPLLGAGSQSIGGNEILQIQSYYLSFIVFGMTLVMGIVYELQNPNVIGAYNARRIVYIMIDGLQKELYERLEDKIKQPPSINSYSQQIKDDDDYEYYSLGPSIDNDGYFDSKLL